MPTGNRELSIFEKKMKTYLRPLLIVPIIFETYPLSSHVQGLILAHPEIY